eukprot:scaffold64630_cov30-Tisochrysis_lutea.AAC.2
MRRKRMRSCSSRGRHCVPRPAAAPLRTSCDPAATAFHEPPRASLSRASRVGAVDGSRTGRFHGPTGPAKKRSIGSTRGCDGGGRGGGGV